MDKLLDSLKALAGKPLAKATAMPRDIYISPEIHQLERELIFAHDWICAGRADEIPNIGDYLTFDLCEQPLLLVRGSDNAIHARANVCLHRMMRLANGHGHTKKFTCPYHAWTYNIDGKLIAAAYMDKSSCFTRENMHLPEIRCELFHGWIYVTMNNDAVPIKDLLFDLDPLVKPYQMEQYVTIFRQQHVWQTNWKHLTENFMEGYHLPVAHKNTVGAYFGLMDTTFDERGSFDNFTYQTFTKSGSAPVGSAHPDNKTLTGKDRFTSIMPTVFPSHMYVLAPDHLWYLSLQPMGIDQVNILYGAAIAPETLAAQNDVDEYIAKTRAFLDDVQEEDRFVVESIFKGAQAPLSTSGPLSWLERENHEFTQYLARRLCNGR
ncbi:Rieske 2Fe-2S domain-containing protein [Alphaproteobacteria bacterium]|nr:Rieske 2Fe-2S domain-containing protein [Alphaproteobacteria bacterium]